MIRRSAPAARVRNPPALPSSELELLDRAGRQLGEERVEALEGLESPQYTDEADELGAVACLDTLEGALAEASPLGKLGLSETCLYAVALDPLAKDVSDGGVRQTR
jgi:hypothetical protein